MGWAMPPLVIFDGIGATYGVYGCVGVENMRVRKGIDCINLRMLDSVGRKSPIYICI